MRKIAMISEHASPLAAPGSVDSGGQNVYVAQVASHLARLGLQVDIFTRRDAPGLRDVIRWRPGVRVIHVPAGPAHFLPKEQMLGCMPAFADFVTGFMRRQSGTYELAHAHFFMSGLVAQQLKQATGLPYVMTFHALGRVRRRHQGSADGFPAARIPIEIALMQDAARIIAECPQDRQDMQDLYGAPPGRIDVVPCGFDPAEMGQVGAGARARLGLDAQAFIVLQLGRMVARKGIATVIAAIARLRELAGVRAQLLVVGGGPREAAELQRLTAIARQLGVLEQVVFAGVQPRELLRYYYSASDVFVTTPWYEPFGITPVEAMACGTPVVGAAVGGIKSTVVDGLTGFLVPPDDPDAVAQRLALLHAAPALARRMGRHGMQRARDGYTWQSVAQRIAGVYARALRETDPSDGNGSQELQWTN